VADGSAADVRLGDLVHRDRAHHPGRHAGPLEGILQRESVHHGREHPDVVAGRTVHAARRRREAAEDVAAADDDADLDAEPMDLGDLSCDERAERGIDAVGTIAEQRLTRQLQEDPLVADALARRRGRGRGRSDGVAHSSSPSA
jgi:hypothetical protein